MGAAMADQQQQQQQQQQQKAKSFPAGLRVLVVDDDPTCLKILDRMLKKCLYEVTTCSRAKAALALLRERKNGFDLVISDVYMPDLDGFELLERVGLEMDLPVIMMSADGGTSTVMKGIKHGACDYLIKPVRVEELQNIWQHVVRKKRNGSKDFDHSTSFDESEKHKKASDDVDYASSANEGTDGNWKLVKKRKDTKDEEDDVDQDAEDPSASKKPRVVWSVELHQQFVNAVNQLGIDKAVPKRILELMHVQGLTRENVASHLQKYRLYLKRLSGVTQQQNGMNSSFGGGTDGSIGHMGLLGRMDLPSFPSNGQISPQALAALPADILGSVNASNGLGMTNVDQSLLLQASFPDNSNLSRRFGPTLMNSQGNLLQGFPSCFESKQYSFAQQQHIPSFVNMCSSVNDTAGAGFSTLQPHVNIGTGIAGVDRSRVLNGTDCSNPQKNALLMQFLQQRHQSNQQQHQLPAPGLQQTSFGQNKSPQLNNGQSNFSPPGPVSMPPVSNDIKSRAPLLSIANSRGCLGNSISVISGPEEVSNPSPAGYGVMASEDNVAESIGRIPASDYKSQNVPMLSGNEYSLASAACLSSSPSVSVDRENGMLGGLTDGIRPSNLNNSAVSFHASHMSNETDRQSWQAQSSVTQDSGQPAMFLTARHPRINGTQAINGVPIQDTTEARQHAFVAKGSSLANRLGHNSLPRMLNITHPALVEADKKLRVKEEHMTELPFNLKNESALLSEPFTDDLMNMFLNQQTGGPGPDDFNLDPF